MGEIFASPMCPARWSSPCSHDKLQEPISKLQRNINLQAPEHQLITSVLELENWSFSGVWSLVFGPFSSRFVPRRHTILREQNPSHPLRQMLQMPQHAGREGPRQFVAR